MPVAEYILALSLNPPTGLGNCVVGVEASMVALRTLSGRLSRLPPKRDEGARARTEASVSIERLRRCFEEEARVSIEALSVRRLFAIAVL